MPTDSRRSSIRSARRPAFTDRRRGGVRTEVLVGLVALAIGIGTGLLLAGRGSDANARDDGIAAIDPNAETSTDAGAPDLVAPGARPDGSGSGTDRRAVDDGTSIDERDLADLIAANPLLAELRDLLGSDALLDHVTQDEASTAAFLMHLYLGLGDAQRAYDLARRTDPKPGTWAQVAGLLASQGHRKDAADAYSTALEKAGPFQWIEPLSSWARQLADLDPERGVALLEGHVTGASDPDDLRLVLARSLAEAGREEEARTSLLALIAEGRSVESSIDALAEFDLALAESEIRRLIGEGRNLDLYGRLTRLLVEDGRTDEALAAVQEGFALADSDQPGPTPAALFNAALNALGNVVDDATIAAWGASVGNPANVDYKTGSHFAHQGDFDRAEPYLHDAWLAQAETNGYLNGLPNAFLEAKPEVVGAWLGELSATAGTKDEVWGDIADNYWKIGDTAAAEAAWKKALEIDPNDGEWQNKVAAVEAGESPL